MGKDVVDDKIRQQLEKPAEPEKKMDPKDEFRKAVLGVSKLNPEIASVGELIKTAKNMHKRAGMKNIDIKDGCDDTEIYNSKHYIYGELIVRCWRDFMSVKAKEIEDAEKEKNRVRSHLNSEGEESKSQQLDSPLKKPEE